MSAIPQQRNVWQYTAVGEMHKVLQQTSIPMPLNSGSSVVVKVAAVALNPVDAKVVAPDSILRLISKKPGIPGLEYSGVVVGGNLEGTPFKIGTRVYGTDTSFLGVRHLFSVHNQHLILFLNQLEGTMSDYLVAKLGLVFPLPDHLSFEEGAAAPCTGITSFIALAEVGQVKAGDRVFINGGSGGAGTWGILVSPPFFLRFGLYTYIGCLGF